LGGTGFAIARTDERWELIDDLFDPPVRRGAPVAGPLIRLLHGPEEASSAYQTLQGIRPQALRRETDPVARG
jgi:hypothetical protein